MGGVLVVEDEALIAEEILERLNRLGFRVVGICDTAEKAIQAAASLQPDLVLMDIRLKGQVDGIEAAGHIYQQLDIPVVYLTAHSDQATLERAKASAPFGYILKPFQERELLVAIEMASHRHRLERCLRESEQKYAATLASVGDGVIATDADGRITFMNRVAEALTQWSFADARGRHIDEVLPLFVESTRTGRESPAVEALRIQQTVNLTAPALTVTRHGETIPIDDSASPILSDRGKLLGAVVAFRDIRQRRLAEDALKRAEEQLRQAQKMEAIGRLAGGVAHDFNNLITVIIGCTELVLNAGQLDPMSRDMLEQVRQAGERAAGLTSQMLAFSRKQPVKPVALHLGNLVSGTSRMLKRLIGEDVILTEKSAVDQWCIRADPGQIEQVILNLAVNARDAMPHGGRLDIETANTVFTEQAARSRPEVRPGRYVMLSVSDTGAGMDSTTRERVFEPFFTTKDIGKGTGLGLAAVYGIVKQFGGFIDVHSKFGEGTTFKLYFPAESADTKATDRPLQAEVASGHGTETILLVEDNHSVRALTSSALQHYGYQVLEAEGGEAALRLFAEHGDAIHLLVTDVVMPGLSGRDVANKLLALKPSLRILYLSGYTDDAVVRHGVLMGEVDLLQKPFTVNVLARKVREVLDK